MIGCPIYAAKTLSGWNGQFPDIFYDDLTQSLIGHKAGKFYIFINEEEKPILYNIGT